MFFPQKCALNLALMVFIRPSRVAERRRERIDLDSREWRIPADTDWTNKERCSMRELGFDDMDMLKAWLSYTNALPNHAIFCFVP